MTDDETLVAELRERVPLGTAGAGGLWVAYAGSERVLKDRAADRIEALAKEVSDLKKANTRLRRERNEARVKAKESERKSQHWSLTAAQAACREQTGPTAEAYRLERDALAAAIAEALDVLLSAAPRDVLREHDERVKSEAAARALRDFADAHRMPNDWILFIGPDESTVTVNDMLRETAARIEGSTPDAHE